MQVFAEEELFYRDLAEVHLLMDFISGREDKSLHGLKGVPIAAKNGKLKPAKSSQHVVEQICKITYPPDGNAKETAEQAALMLAVKDRLNYLASPARGMTVSFTAMFAGVALDVNSWFARLLSFLRTRQGAQAHSGQRDDDAPEHADRHAKHKRKAHASHPNEQHYYSAQAAYPNLITQAREFRRFYKRLPWYTLVVIILIVLTNLDINITSTTLTQIAAAKADSAQLVSADRHFVPSSETCKTVMAANVQVAVQPASAAESEETIFADKMACREWEADSQRQSAAELNLQNLVFASPLIIHPVATGVRLVGAAAKGDPKGFGALLMQFLVHGSTISPDKVTREWSLEDLTTAVIGGLNSTLVPALFGLLGTYVAVMRSITTKMRDSILAPRDQQLSRIAILLGVSSGLTVGLFFGPSDLAGAISKGLGATISVSAASLAFLAGFGSESFFRFLDIAVARLLTPATAMATHSPSLAPLLAPAPSPMPNSDKS